jgi:hypothetical protein
MHCAGRSTGPVISVDAGAVLDQLFCKDELVFMVEQSVGSARAAKTNSGVALFTPLQRSVLLPLRTAHRDRRTGAAPSGLFGHESICESE